MRNFAPQIGAFSMNVRGQVVETSAFKRSMLMPVQMKRK